MVNGIRTGDPRGFNKGRSWKFSVGSRVRQTPEEDQETYRPKCYGNNNKFEDNSPKTLNDKNHLVSSEKFRQQISFMFLIKICIPIKIGSNSWIAFSYKYSPTAQNLITFH